MPCLDFVRGGSGAGDIIELETTLGLAFPFALSAWVLPGDLTTDGTIVGIFGTALGGTYYRIQSRGTIAGDPFSISARNTTEFWADTTDAYTTTDWQHILGVFASATDRRIYRNGNDATKGSSSTSVTFAGAGLDRIAVGRAHRGATLDGGYDGLISYVTLILREPLLREIQDVGINRAHPLDVFGPDCRVWPCWGIHSPEIEITGKLGSLTLADAPGTSTIGPPIRSRQDRMQSIVIPTAAGGAADPLFPPFPPPPELVTRM